MSKKKPPIRYPGWKKGVNNVDHETEIDRRDNRDRAANSLRAAENVDLTQQGKPRRRPGYTSVYSGTNVHSLYTAPQFLLFNENGTLKRRDVNGTVTTVVTGLDPHNTVSYVEKNLEIYYSNGEQSGIVQYDGTHRIWGVDRPDGQPRLTTFADGGLDAGTYQVAITFLDSFGRESGTGSAATIEVTQGQGVTLNEIPQSPDSNVTTIRIYRSEADGSVLFRYVDLAHGTTSSVIGPGFLDKSLQVQFGSPPPAGHLLTELYGRIFIAVDSTVYYTEAMNFDLVMKSRNFLMLPSYITLLATVNDGIYVASGNRTLFWGGTDPTKFKQRVVYIEGCIEGTLTYVPGSSLPFEQVTPTDMIPVWAAKNGVIVVGLPGGNLVPINEGSFRFPDHEKGASLFREREGIRQVLVSMQNSGPTSKMNASDSVSVEIIRGTRFDS